MKVVDYWDRADGRRRVRPPLSVVVGVTSYVAGIWWVNELEPRGMAASGLYIDLNLWGLLFGVALVIGTLRGVRMAWGLVTVGSAFLAALCLGEAINDATAQTIGGFILITMALVCLMLPTSQRFEHRRIRLVIDENGDAQSRGTRPVMWWLGLIGLGVCAYLLMLGVFSIWN
jgi:hypothetical protein